MGLGAFTVACSRRVLTVSKVNAMKSVMLNYLDYI